MFKVVLHKRAASYLQRLSKSQKTRIKDQLKELQAQPVNKPHVKQMAGEVIEKYPDDKPFPSALFMGMINDQPIHVVAAFDNRSKFVFVITGYKPDQKHFYPDYKTRGHHGS